MNLTKNATRAKINALLPDNDNRVIKASDLREVLNNILDTETSLSAGITTAIEALIEDSICITDTLPKFSPGNFNNPTTAEVLAYLDANYQGLIRINGTKITYYRAEREEHQSILYCEMSEEVDSTSIIVSFNINGTEIIVSPLLMSNPLSNAALTSLINNYAAINGLTCDITYMELIGYAFEMDGLNKLVSIVIETLTDGIVTVHNFNNSAGVNPSIGSAESPLHVWTVTESGIIRETQMKPWAKTEDVSTSNTEESVFDAIYHVGKEQVGANFNNFPPKNDYVRQTFGNHFLTGSEKANMFFSSLKNGPAGTVIVHINNETGNDNLEDPLYVSSSFPFKSINAAFNWIARNREIGFWVTIEKTSTDYVITQPINVIGKSIWLRNNELSGVAPRIRIQGGGFNFYNCSVSVFMSSHISFEGGFNGFYFGYSKAFFAFFNAGKLEAVANISNGIVAAADSQIAFSGTWVERVFFTQNNQYFIGAYGNSSIAFTDGMIGFNTGILTGLQLIRPGSAFRSYPVYMQTGSGFPAGLGIDGAILHYNKTIVIGQQIFDTTNQNYRQVLHGATPIRLPDLNAAPEMTTARPLVVDANGVVGWQAHTVSYTNATKPATGVAGQIIFVNDVASTDGSTGTLMMWQPSTNAWKRIMLT
jgi:hypothetical protein